MLMFLHQVFMNDFWSFIIFFQKKKTMLEIFSSIVLFFRGHVVDHIAAQNVDHFTINGQFAFTFIGHGQ